MNSPSAVSMMLMPAANRIGRVSTAYQGSPAAAPVPARASSATSVAVSNPSPNSTPTGNSCTGRGRGVAFRDRGQGAGHHPAVVQMVLQFALVEFAAAHRTEDAPDPDQRDE